jgi:hypothetical protein
MATFRGWVGPWCGVDRKGGPMRIGNKLVVTEAVA